MKEKQKEILYNKENNSLKLTTLWKDIKESVSGTEQDFTKGNLGRGILLLSIPMVLEMVMESVFAVVDIFFVSKLGAEAVATVGITESLMTIIYAVAVGLSAATTALVSRRIGEKNSDGASVSAFQAILVCMFIGLLFAIPGILYSKEILGLMGSSDRMIEQGHKYPSIMLGGNIIIMLLFVMNAILRSAGDAAVSMRVLWMANLINIVLDPCLIFGIGPFPQLGVTGAAIATNIGRGLAVVYQFYLLFNGKTRVQIRMKHVMLNIAVMFRLLKISMGGIGQHLITTSSWIILVRLISEFGSNAVAGYTIGIRIILFTILPSFGLSNAASTLVGQNLGAKQPRRAERSVWLTSYVNMFFLTLVAIIFISFPRFFVELFIQDENVISYGVSCLKIISYGYLSFGLGMIMVQALNGAGDTFTPTIINLFCYWLLELPLAYFLAMNTGIEEKGVFISIVVADTLMAAIGLYVFKKGHWKLRKV